MVETELEKENQSSHLGYGGRGGKDQYVRERCSAVASFLVQETKEEGHHSLVIPGALFGEEPPPPQFLVLSPG